MKKIIAIITSAVAVLIVVTAFLFAPLYMSNSKIFAHDETVILNNPMQGFYTQTDTSDAPYTLTTLKASGMSLALLACNLNGYQAKPLDDSKLSEIKTAFETAKTEKIDIVFRAAYGFIEGLDTEEPLSLDIVLNHISQISEAIKPYSDIILCVQAGMIGPWGEWHNSSLLSGYDDAKQTEIKNSVVKAWVDGLPDENTIIVLRRPEFVRQAVAFGIPIKRLGFHNDALLADRSDMGTYIGDENIRQNELNWVNENLPNSHFGGEMTNIGAYTEPLIAADEFKKLRLTYLNSGYNKQVLDDWKKKQVNGENAYDYINKHMGSRLFINKTTSKKGFLKSGSLDVTLTIENVGFALTHPSLNFWIAIKQDKNVSYFPLKDIFLNSENQTLTLKAEIDASFIMSNSSFSIGLKAGFGSPEDGRPFSLANKDLIITDDTTYFAQYTSFLNMWKLDD